MAQQRCPPPYKGYVELQCMDGVLSATANHNCTSRLQFGSLSPSAEAASRSCSILPEDACVEKCEWDAVAGCIPVPMGYFKIIRGINYHGIEEGAAYAIAEMSRFTTNCPTTGWTKWSVCNVSTPCERGIQNRTREPLAGVDMTSPGCTNLQFLETRPCTGPGFCPEILTRFVAGSQDKIDSFMGAYELKSKTIGVSPSAGAHMLPSPYPSDSDAEFWCSMITGDSKCSMYFEGQFEVKEDGHYSLEYTPEEGGGELEFNTFAEGDELKPQYLVVAGSTGSEMFEWQDVGFHHRRRRTGVKPWQKIASMSLARGRYFTRLTRSGWRRRPSYSLALRHASNVFGAPALEGVGTTVGYATDALGTVTQNQKTWQNNWGYDSYSHQYKSPKEELGFSNEIVIQTSRRRWSIANPVSKKIQIDKLSYTADELYNLTGLDRLDPGGDEYAEFEMVIRSTVILPSEGQYTIRYLQNTEWDESVASWRQESRRRHTDAVMRVAGTEIAFLERYVGSADLHATHYATSAGAVTLEISTKLDHEGIGNKPVLPNFFAVEMKKEDLMHGETLAFGTATPYMAELDAIVGDDEVRIDWPDRSDPLSSELRTQTFQPLSPNKLLIGIPNLLGFLATAEGVIDAGACLSLEAKADPPTLTFGGLALILCDLDGKSQYLKLITYENNRTNDVGWVHIGFNQPTHLRIKRDPNDLQSFEISYRPDDRMDFAASFNTDAVRAAAGDFTGHMSVGVSMNGPEAYRYAEFYNISIEDCPTSCSTKDDHQLLCGEVPVACGGALSCPATCTDGRHCHNGLCMLCPPLILTPEQELWECGTVGQVCSNHKGEQIQVHRTLGIPAPSPRHVCQDHVWICHGTSKWEYLLQGLECGTETDECGEVVELFDCPRTNDQCINHKCTCHPTVFSEDNNCGWAGDGCGQNVTFGAHGGGCADATAICPSTGSCTPSGSELSATCGQISGSFTAGPDYLELPGAPNENCVGSSCTGDIKFVVTCSEATAVKFKAEVVAADGRSDSFYIKSNSGDYKTWHFGFSIYSFGWTQASPEVLLDKDLNLVTIAGREDGLKVRKFSISSGSDTCQWFQSTGMTANQCCTPKTVSTVDSMYECGQVQDGCGGVVLLPACAEGFACEDYKCVELPFVPFIVTKGTCPLSDGGKCVSSGNYGSGNNYDNRESCDITPPSGKIKVVAFDTESGYDKLKVNGAQYHGKGALSGTFTTNTQITWYSDGSVTRSGWKLCAE
eukprot:gnl/MRDRNA2_/MRDRNA2_89101_c0_seq1.p1 gnl/MRDRNA2_/MRDRNA2_89101_c0~~gnl/MRDRNA2_/MRDRNA2_89101_c0_seq1.p1  ORF type:complete len:1303 (+),score=170.88 gnl/MRDRNA2_/MRDRNA2_89101_c0_seq1:188-3910(+)